MLQIPLIGGILYAKGIGMYRIETFKQKIESVSLLINRYSFLLSEPNVVVFKLTSLISILEVCGFNSIPLTRYI